MIKRFLATAALLAAGITPAFAGNTIEDHNELWRALVAQGIEVAVNDPNICKDNWGGAMYIISRHDTAGIMICQDQGQRAGYNNQVRWTANDLDSLRHEAHHAIQDCLEGVKTDGALITLFNTNTSQHRDFVLGALPQEQVARIIRDYGSKGEHIVLLELEAFAVAATVDASKITAGVNKACSL